MKKLFRSDDGKFEHEDEAKVRAYEDALTPFSHFGLPLELSSHDNQRIIKASHVGLSPQDTLVVMHTFNLVEDIYRFLEKMKVAEPEAARLLSALKVTAQGRKQ